MTNAEFAKCWRYLEDNCADLPREKRDNRMSAFKRYWSPFRAEIMQRAIDWYLENEAEQPFFPTLGQLIAAQEAGRAPADSPPPPTRADREQARKDLAEWENSPEYKLLMEKHGL